MEFTVNVHKDEDGGFWAEVAELPGCITQGASIEEVEENVKDAIEAMLEGLIDDYVDGLDHRVEFEQPDERFVLAIRLQRQKTPAKR
jgi:predicted RNase H-like HicB family nuclease